MKEILAFLTGLLLLVGALAHCVQAAPEPKYAEPERCIESDCSDGAALGLDDAGYARSF